ncbi:MAG: ABC transporter substrate-binding protein [Desulfobacter sp.]|nr:ABC transporter substrate-binding protein [Desulfobacter sp.]
MKYLLKGLICLAGISLAGPSLALAFNVGTWKTAQTIQPFYYHQFTPNRVKVFSFTNPADQKTALLAGDLDICGTTLAHAIHSAALGQPVVVVAALCNKCSAFVVRKNAGIKRVADLRGKKIGYVPGTMHEILLRESLVRNNLLPEKDVRLTRVDFFDMGLALARGGIDAFVSGEPFPTLALVKGYGQILSYPYYGDSIGSINGGMLVSQKTIENRPDLVLKMVRAHARATQFLKQHPGIWLEKAESFGTPMTVLEKAAPNMELAWDMDRDFIRKTRALGERMQALGLIKDQPDYSRLFDLSFVNQIREEKGQAQ